MLCTFTDGVNGRVKGLHDVVDDDAAFTIQAGLFGEFRIGNNADTHYHEVGRYLCTILEAHPLYVAVADNFFCCGFHQESHAALFK